MTRRKLDELSAPAREKRIGTDEEAIRPLLHPGIERGLEVAVRPDPEHDHLLSTFACCVVNKLHLPFNSKADWIHEECNRGSAGHQLVQQLQALRHQLGGVQRYAREIATWPVKTAHKTIRNRVGTANAKNWYGRSDGLCGTRQKNPAGHDD